MVEHVGRIGCGKLVDAGAGGIAIIAGPRHPVRPEAGLAGQRLVEREPAQGLAALAPELGEVRGQGVIGLSPDELGEAGVNQTEHHLLARSHLGIIDQVGIAQFGEQPLERQSFDGATRGGRDGVTAHRRRVDQQNVEEFAARRRIGAEAQGLGGEQRVERADPDEIRARTGRQCDEAAQIGEIADPPIPRRANAIELDGNAPQALARHPIRPETTGVAVGRRVGGDRGAVGHAAGQRLEEGGDRRLGHGAETAPGIAIPAFDAEVVRASHDYVAVQRTVHGGSIDPMSPGPQMRRRSLA